MPALLRLTQLLTMVVWVGGLVFFAFVLAPAAFSALPNQHEAGLIVAAALRPLHTIGLVCGALFLLATATMFRRAPSRIRGRYEIEFILAALMILSTAYLQWNVLPSMDRDRDRAGGDISAVALTHPARLHFDQLHRRSEHAEGFVLFCGLGIVFLISREQASFESSANPGSSITI